MTLPGRSGEDRTHYDAVLVVSFGGPERREDVIPFLENVLRSRNVPLQRMLEVAEHYYRFGGCSPINDENRALIKALEAELSRAVPRLPVYWGNRNWHPLLADTLRRMASDGVRRALAFVTSAFSSYSGCRQYLEDIERARSEVGAQAPVVHKLRGFFNHPGFIEAVTDRLRSAIKNIPPERRDPARVLFSAHSLPVAMAQGCDYQAQLGEASRLVAAGAGIADWQLVYQSRSGPPAEPWLEPDIAAALRAIAAAGGRDVVVVPIGFISDHMEVLYDLDTEARDLSAGLGLNLTRVATPGAHPSFIGMIRELIAERVDSSAVRPAAGSMPAQPDSCAAGCCPIRVTKPA